MTSRGRGEEALKKKDKKHQSDANTKGFFSSQQVGKETTPDKMENSVEQV